MVKAEDGGRPEDKRFGARVRELREESGMKLADLVEEMQSAGVEYMNTSTLSRIENGIRPVRLSEAQVISQIFRVSLEVLVLEESWVVRFDRTVARAYSRYMRFKQMAIDVTRDQLHLVDILESIEKNALMSEATMKAVEGSIGGARSLVSKDLGVEVARVAEETKRAWVRNEKSGVGQLLNLHDKGL